MKLPRISGLRSTCVAGLVLVASTAGGCASRDRVDELGDRSRGVERFLETQLDSAKNVNPNQTARFDQLTGLRRQLSVANVAIGAVPLLGLSDQEKNSAYDVLDEYLGNIRWNAALPPDATPKRLDSSPQLSPILGKLNLVNP